MNIGRHGDNEPCLQTWTRWRESDTQRDTVNTGQQVRSQTESGPVLKFVLQDGT